MDTRKHLESLTYIVPPEFGGQIVEVAFGNDEEGERIIRRTTDRSLPADDPGRVTYEEAAWEDTGDFEPWNRVPESKTGWRSIRLG